MSTAIDTRIAGGHARTSGRIRRYFLLVATVALLEAFVSVLVLSWPSYDGLLNSDHLLQITSCRAPVCDDCFAFGIDEHEPA